MSRTLLELTLALVAAVLVFLLALELVPLLIERLTRYVNRRLNGDPTDAYDHFYSRNDDDTDDDQDDHAQW